jgi:hypothetical protein
MSKHVVNTARMTGRSLLQYVNCQVKFYNYSTLNHTTYLNTNKETLIHRSHIEASTAHKSTTHKTHTTEQQTSGYTRTRNKFRAGRAREVYPRDHQPRTAGALPLLTRRGSATSLDPEASWTGSRSIDAASKQLVRQQIHEVTT